MRPKFESSDYISFNKFLVLYALFVEVAVVISPLTLIFSSEFHVIDKNSQGFVIQGQPLGIDTK